MAAAVGNLPEGFVLDKPKKSGGLPDGLILEKSGTGLPEGFVLDEPAAPIGMLNAAARGVGGEFSTVGRGLALAASTPAMLIDKAIGGTKAQDWMFKNVVDPASEAQKSYEFTPEEQKRATTGEKVAYGVGSFAADLPVMMATGGAGGTAIKSTIPLVKAAIQAGFPREAAAIFGETAAKQFGHAAATMSPVTTAQALDHYQKLKDQGVDTTTAVKAAVAGMAATTAGAMVPLAKTGGLAKRAAVGAAAGTAMTPTSATIQNAITGDKYPELHQDPFDEAGMITGAVTMAAMGGAMGPRGKAAKTEPFKPQEGLGYEGKLPAEPGFDTPLQGLEPVKKEKTPAIYRKVDKLIGKSDVGAIDQAGRLKELEPPNVANIIKAILGSKPVEAKPYTGMDKLLGEAKGLGEGKEIPKPPTNKEVISPSMGSLIKGLSKKPVEAKKERPLFTPIDPANEDGAHVSFFSETREGGKEGGEQFKIAQVLHFLKPKLGPDTSEIDAALFEAGAKRTSETVRQNMVNRVITALKDNTEARSVYPEFYNKDGAVNKDAVNDLAPKYNVAIGTEMNNARRANDGEDIAIHPTTYGEMRDTGGLTKYQEEAPAETPSGKPAPKAKAPVEGEIPKPPEQKNTVEFQGKTHTLTDAQMKEWKEAKAEHNNRVRSAETKTDKNERDSDKKRAGMRLSAKQRKITGELTAKERVAAEKKEETNYVGKKVQVNGENAEIVGNPFGKVKVKFEDGKTVTVHSDEVVATKTTGKTPGEGQVARDKPGPGTLSSNPFLDPKVIKQTLSWAAKPLLATNKFFQKRMNAIQAIPDSAMKAVGVTQEYARAVSTARLSAQMDKASKYLDSGTIAREFKEAMDLMKQVDPTYPQKAVTTAAEASAATERAMRRIAEVNFQNEMIRNGYAIVPGKATNAEGFREAKDFEVLKRGIKPLHLRNDAADAVEQMVAGHDKKAEEDYMKTFGGGLEGTAHGMTSISMLGPAFHVVTTFGKWTTGAAALPKKSAARYLGAAKEANENKEAMKYLSNIGMQFFPKGHSMLVLGAEKGAVENFMSHTGISRKVYDGYQKMHNGIVADGVNIMQISYYMNRLEQLKAAHKGTIDAKTMRTYENMAARDSNVIGGNLPKEEIARSWSRFLGTALFSRGLQVNTVRMATRSVEGDKLLGAMATRNGLTKEQAQKLVTVNQRFLARQMVKDLLIMHAVTNGINLAATAYWDEPNGKKGAHLVWENQGSDKLQKFIPTNMFVGVYNGKGIYASTPFRTFRDIAEYLMLLPEIAMGQGAKILQNKASGLGHIGQMLMTGKDWAGRPLKDAYDDVASVAGQVLPAPINQIPAYAAEAARQGSWSYFKEGLADVLRPANSIPILAGFQVKAPKEDPETSMKAAVMAKAQNGMWAYASQMKTQIKRFPPEEREKAIRFIVEKARKETPLIAKVIEKHMYAPEVTKNQYKQAATQNMLDQEQKGNMFGSMMGIPTPPQGSD